jgi:hypothetical protein
MKDVGTARDTDQIFEMHLILVGSDFIRLQFAYAEMAKSL